MKATFLFQCKGYNVFQVVAGELIIVNALVKKIKPTIPIGSFLKSEVNISIPGEFYECLTIHKTHELPDDSLKNIVAEYAVKNYNTQSVTPSISINNV